MKKTIYILLVFTIISCGKTANDARKIKLGMSGNELKYIMGEPREIRINNGSETWGFRYSGQKWVDNDKRIVIEMVNDKIVDFNTY